jgi:2-polyprenyl-3-methyl-5-hydroxy-6-metoxy-1,4-benzoquinol methylase
MKGGKMVENFDLLANEWDNDPARVDRARVVASELIKDIKLGDGMTAFEYGCGTGLLSFQLRDSFKSITMADNSEGMLAVLLKKIMRAGVSNLTPLKLDLAVDEPLTTSYEVIFTLMTMHHVIDVEGILLKFRKMLNPSSYLCIADLDREDGSFHGKGFDGHNGFDRRELAVKLESIGFRVVADRIIYQVVKVRDGQERRYPLFLMTGKKL